MFKALFKKQFAELNAFYFFDKKTGKLRSRGKIVGISILYGFLFLFLAGVFLGLSVSLAVEFLPAGLDWLYFAMLGLIAIALGAFGSAFNTYAGLYQAKDNELLLAMPIPPSYILSVRICGVCLMSLLYTALVWIPACLVYIFHSPSLTAVIFSLLLTLVLTAFVSVLTCALGWLVALISGKLKNKSFITVILSLAFITIYYVIYFRFSELLENILANTEKVGNVMKTWLFPLYMLGRAASGEVIPMLVFTGLTAALCALCLRILSRGFIRIVTTPGSTKKAVYREEKSVRTATPARALLGKELKRFTSSATYMLNCGLGLILLPVLAVFVLIKAPALRALIDSFAVDLPGIGIILPMVVVAALFFTLSLNLISAPSVSLEGKNIWIAQSMPVSAREVLLAKERLHVLLNAIPTAVTVLILAIVTRSDLLTTLFMLILSGFYIYFTGDLGLWLNLKQPSLDWTSETIPVKQGFAIVAVLFIGWGIAIAAAGLAFLFGFLLPFLPPFVPIAILTAVMAAITLSIRRKLLTRGAQIFADL